MCVVFFFVLFFFVVCVFVFSAFFAFLLFLFFDVFVNPTLRACPPATKRARSYPPPRLVMIAFVPLCLVHARGNIALLLLLLLLSFPRAVSKHGGTNALTLGILGA